MVALEIIEIGTLFRQMLKGTLFDHFLLQEADISLGIDYRIDGQMKDGFFSEEEIGNLHLSGCRYIPFSHVRPIVFEIMKGTRKPSFFRFVFLLSPQNQANTVAKCNSSYRTEDVTGMFLNLTYRNNQLVCTTGISYRTFSMDKSLEAEWDRLTAVFFRQHGIATVDLSGNR